MNKVLLSIYTMFLVFCSAPRTNHPKKLKFTFQNDSLKLSTYFNNVEYKFFNMPDSIVIGNISNYFKSNNYQVIVDRKYTKAIYLFDDQNNFLKRFRKIGDGPGEYSKIVSCSIDEKTDRLFVFDRHKINIYSIPSFSLLKNIDVTGFGAIADMEVFNESIFLYSVSKYSNKQGLLGRIKIEKPSEIEILIEEIPDILNRIHAIGLRHFAKTDSKLYFISSFIPNIFSIDKKNKLRNEYSFYNEEFIADYSKFIGIKEDDKLYEFLMDYYTSIYTFNVVDSLLYIKIPFKNFFYAGFCEIGAKAIDLYKLQINDIDLNKIITSDFVSNNLNQHIEMIHQEELYNIEDTINESSKTIESYRNFNKKIENKNCPILLFFK